ncbi:MAG: peptidyl-prolyl cis-trans isomerase [Anditalea sp.]
MYNYILQINEGEKKGSQILLLKNSFLILVGSLVLSGCDFFKFKAEEDVNDTVLASVDDNLLRLSDLDVITEDTSSEKDSANLAERYLQSWVKKQLMIKEAGKNMAFDEAELNRKLLDYRYALMVYEFEKSYVEENLDENVSEAEIVEYYKQNQTNFTLKKIIVRTNFLKTEKDIPQKGQIERLLKSDRDRDQKELKEMALRLATNYYLEDSTWIEFDDIIVNTPLIENSNNVQLLAGNKLIQVEDEDYSYYFKILEYKLQDQVPPIKFVEEEISKIIINKRKVALAEELHKKVYDRALEKNDFKIYD